MAQAELAGKIGVTDKAISRWERGIGFSDINALEPSARALDVAVFELMHSEKSGIKSDNMPERQIVEIMDKAVEMSKGNRRRDCISQWLADIVAIAIAIVQCKLPCEEYAANKRTLCLKYRFLYTRRFWSCH